MASSSGIRAGLAYVELLVKDNLAKGLSSAAGKLKAFGSSITSLGKRLSAIGGIVTTPLLAAAKASASAGADLLHMAERTGVSVEELSVLGKVAALSGLSLEDLDSALRKMQKSLVGAATDSGSAGEALDILKLSMKDLARLSPDQQFKLIGDRLSKLPNPALRTAVAMDLFGRSGANLLPLFARGSAGLEEMENYFRSLGMVMTKEGAQKANAFNNALKILWMVAKRAMGVMGSALIPTLGGVVQRMITAGAVVVNWVKANQALVVTVFKIAAAVTGAGLALVVLGKGLTIIAAVVKGASVACSVLAATIGAIGSMLGFVLTPLGGVIVLLGGLAAYLVSASGAGAKLLTWLGEKFAELRETALAAFKGISDAMATGNMALAAKILWLALKIAWQNGTAELQKGWLTFSGWFQKIAYGAFYGVQAASEYVTHGIVTAWVEGVAYIQSAWVSLSSLVASTNEAMVNGFVKAWIWAKSKTDSSFDAAFASEYANKQHGNEQARIDREKRTAMQQIESERAANAEYAQKQHDARLAEVGQAYTDAAAAVEADKAAKVQQAASELNQAKADLQAAIDQAARPRAASGSGKPMPLLGAAPGFGQDAMSLSDLLANSAKHTIGVAGTFNAAEARGLGSGGVVDRIANATDATAKNTRKLLDKLRGQAVFE